LTTDSLGLSDNYINGFCEDDDRNIWIATSGGLNKYIRKTDKIVRYKWNNNDAPELDELGYYGILKDEFDSNIIWLSDFNRGLIKLNISSNNSTIYSLNGNKGIISTWFLSYPGNKNKLLLGGSKLFSFDKKSGKFNEILKLEQNSVVPNNLINDAVLDPANKEIIWLATGDFWGRGSLGGLIRYNLRTGWKKIFKPENRSGDLPDKHLMSLSFDGNNNLWIGSRYKGVFLYNKKEDKFYNFINNEFDDESFATFNSVRSILKDKSGTIWFGTWGDGISLLSPSLQKFSHYNYLPNDNNGLLNNYVNTFAEDKEGNIWIGTQAGGLSKFNPGTLLFENYFQEFILHKKNKTSITYLYYDSFENLWVGTYDDALYRFNPKTGRKIHYKKGVSKKEVTQNRISGIAEIKKGEILISTYGGGLNIYTYTNDSFKHFLNNPDDSTSIPDNQIWLPFSDNDGNYYFSGNSVAGLIKFVPKTGKFYLTNISENITTFTMPCKTYDETVYINDVAEGLREIDLGKELTVNTIYDIDGNSIKNIVSILVDSDNNLWLGTGNGLIEYDPETKITKRYNTDDGLQGNEFNRFAALKSSTGEMYFGGKKGFSVFNPGEIKISKYKPPIVFVDFKLFQKSVELGDDSVLKENILLTNKIKLDHSQNDFSVSFAALDYSNPNKIHYKYMLENHDKEWIEVGNRNFASYTNMDPGKYIFKVLATNSDGVWLDKPTTLKIIITPPWWQTTFAYISYGIIFVLGVFGVDRFQRRKLLAKAREKARIKESEMRAQIAEAENERKTKELEEARQLQLSMLPEDLPNLPNLDIAVYMQTATEVGGDYYDFHVGMDGTLTVVVGDATGHGMKAGTMVTATKSLFNILAPNPDILATFSLFRNLTCN